jgi:hypothetical protein
MVWNNPHFPVEGQWLTPEKCEIIVAEPIFRHPLFHVENEIELCLLVEMHHLRVFNYKNLPDLKQLRRDAKAIIATTLKLERLLTSAGTNIDFPLLRGYFDREGDKGYRKAKGMLSIMLRLLDPAIPARKKDQEKGRREVTYIQIFHKHWLGEKKLASDFIDLCYAVSRLANDDVNKNTVRSTIIKYVKAEKVL